MSESVIDSTRRVVREASPDEDAAFRKRLAESRSEKPESLKPIDGPRFLIVYVDGGRRALNYTMPPIAPPGTR